MVLAVGSISVSIVSVKGRRGGSAIVSACGVAAKAPAGSGAAVERKRHEVELVAVEHERRVRLARPGSAGAPGSRVTRVAVGWSRMSSSTRSIRKSLGR